VHSARQYPAVTAVFLSLKKEYRDVIADITKRMGAGMSNFIKREARGLLRSSTRPTLNRLLPLLRILHPCAWVRAFSLKVSRGLMSVESLFSMTLMQGGDAEGLGRVLPLCCRAGRHRPVRPVGGQLAGERAVCQGGGAVELHGRAVQVDPMKPKLKPPGTKRLKLEYDGLLSRSGLKSNLRRYTMGLFLQKTNIIRDYLEDIEELPAPRMFWPKVVGPGVYCTLLATSSNIL